MALFRKFFYRKPPDGLLEISERVYVFDCCFTTDMVENEEYKNYIGGIVGHLRDYLPNASSMVVNFRDGEAQSQVAQVLSEYDMTVMEYPRHYEGCPLLTMEIIHHFLRSCENWLVLGQQNVLLMHCERGGWPVLAFMLAALLIYRKQYTGEQKTLDMIYKQAPSELLQLMSPLNPLPSQLRYLQYVSRRNLGSQWPPLSRVLTLDCIIIRCIPDIDGKGGCQPIVRIYGPDPLNFADQSPKVLFSTSIKSKSVRYCKQADCDLVKIDINCYIQGDVILECISLDDGLEGEHKMFRVMFNTSFIRSNILTLNRDEVDILWNVKDRFPKDFRTEVIFSEMDIATSLVSVDLPGFEEKEGLPVEAFARVQELFSNADWLDQKKDAAVNVLQQIKASNILQELETDLSQGSNKGNELFGSALEMIKHEPKASKFFESAAYTNQVKKSISPFNSSLDVNLISQKFLPKELQTALQRSAPSKVISHRVHGNFLSSPTSIQGSPIAMSRYQNASSPLGITALLEDHVPHSTKEVIHSGTVAGTSVTSSPTILTVSRPVHMNAPVHPSSLTVFPPSQFANDACTTALTTALLSNSNSSVLKPLQPIAPSVQPPLISPLSTQYYNGVLNKTVLSSALSASHVSPKTIHPSGIQDDKGQVSVVPCTPLPSPYHHKTTSPTAVSPPSISPPLFQGASQSYSVGKLSSEAPSPPVISSFQGPIPYLRDIKSYPSSFCPPSPPPPPPPPPPPSTSASSIMQVAFRPPLTPLNSVTTSIATCPVSSAKPMGITLTSNAPSPPPPSPSPPPLLSSGPGSVPLSTMFAPLTLGVSASATCPVSPPMPMENTIISSAPPPPPPPLSIDTSSVPPTISAPPPPPPLGFGPKSCSKNPPPPLATSAKGLPRADSALESESGCKNVTAAPVPGPSSGAILSAKGQGLARPNFRSQVQSKRNNLKPYHWLKLTRAVQGSLWADSQKSDDTSMAPEFDMKELESLFSAAVPSCGKTGGKSNHRVAGHKLDKIQLVELRRANNCEIMLTKVKIPIPDLMSSVLALDDSMLEGDQVENLIKFCPTKEEIELLKGYKGNKENLGKCEQFFLELMKVPRVESKLRVLAFKIQYSSQVSDLTADLNVVNSASEEIRNSVKLKRIMQTILSLGNAMNHGTARGSAVGFRLDSLLKLTDTRARNNKMTLMHYLCKVLAEKLPELLDFPKDLVNLEAASKIQLKYLAEEMQAISKGLEKVGQELTASENDGPVSVNFCKTLKDFLGYAEAEVRSLASLYSIVGRSADALSLYFGEDPARCPFEQVVSTLSNFVKMFVRAHKENCKQLEFEKKKAQKNAENEKVKVGAPMEAELLKRSPIQTGNN